MGLFSKKVCDICGNEIKLLGNKKLSDANMCKECAAKLSPWFTGRRKSTLEDIKEQLAYREENQKAVDAFRVTRTFDTGTNYKVLLDEDAKKLIVTNVSNYKDSNPDVLDLDRVTGCMLDVTESKSEIHRTGSDGKQVSYNPPRYKYSYDFYIVMNVDNPFFDEIKFKINNSQVVINPYEGNQVRVAPHGNGVADAIVRGLAGALGANGQGMYSPEYERYKDMGDSICQAIMDIRQGTRSGLQYSENDPAIIKCPWCGASSKVTATGHCEYCGGALDQ